MPTHPTAFVSDSRNDEAQKECVRRAWTARFLKVLRKWLLSQDGNKEALRLNFFARREGGGSSEGEADQ
jgi:hypothetical protein